MKKKTYPLVYAGKKQRFARSVVVGDLVFVSGSSGRTLKTGEVSSDRVKEQMIVALDKIRGALEEAGSSMDHVVKTVIYLKRMEDYQAMRDTELEYYEKMPPALWKSRRPALFCRWSPCPGQHAHRDRRDSGKTLRSVAHE